MLPQPNTTWGLARQTAGAWGSTLASKRGLQIGEDTHSPGHTPWGTNTASGTKGPGSEVFAPRCDEALSDFCGVVELE